MSKEDILILLDTAMTDPGSYKSGEYLEEHAFDYLNKIINSDREGIIEALREWIGLRSEPETMLAVRLARRLKISEVIPQIKKLRKEVDKGNVFMRYYLTSIDQALDVLQSITK
jgi:hypothetical protein